MVRSGFEREAEGWQAQTNQLSYGGTPLSNNFRSIGNRTQLTRQSRLTQIVDSAGQPDEPALGHLEVLGLGGEAGQERRLRFLVVIGIGVRRVVVVVLGLVRAAAARVGGLALDT